jgi:hypothetical protein
MILMERPSVKRAVNLLFISGLAEGAKVGKRFTHY